jgi:hypothetical protein
VNVTGGFQGFDWDNGKYLLQTSRDLRATDQDEVAAIQRRMNDANGPYVKAMSELRSLRGTLERLRGV